MDWTERNENKLKIAMLLVLVVVQKLFRDYCALRNVSDFFIQIFFFLRPRSINSTPAIFISFKASSRTSRNDKHEDRFRWERRFNAANHFLLGMSLNDSMNHNALEIIRRKMAKIIPKFCMTWLFSFDIISEIRTALSNFSTFFRSLTRCAFVR